MIPLKNKTMFCLDMDGTIYHENTLIPGAQELFELFNVTGKHYVFMTNNSSKNRYAYVEKLNGLGISATINQIFSSVQSTINYLHINIPHAKIYLIGTKSFKEELISEGFKVVSSQYRKSDIDCVIVGFDTELTYEKLRGACYYVSEGVPYLGTNCDMKCPVKGSKYIPDCGAICEMIRAATNKTPLFLGKPNAYMINAVMRCWNVIKDDILCIGDRLYTDIAVGINAGVDTAVVLTGEATEQEILSSPFKPTYCFSSIEDIYRILL